MKPAPILRTSLVIFLSLLAAVAGLRAAELAVPENVVFERDIEFANPDNQHLQVNMARPKDGAGPFPAVVCIHGGGFRARPPHSPTPVPVLTVSGAAGAKAIS